MVHYAAASHQDVLLLVMRITLLLFTARAFGEVAQRLGQPAVVGEILAGIVLGPSLLSSLFPALGIVIVPQTADQWYMLEVVSLIGVMFLLLITGLETDIPLIRRHARTALATAAGGLILPFFSGFLLGLNLPEFLLGNPDERLVFALFVAAALSISAIPVIAKVLIDLNLLRRDIGQTIIAAGMVDDTFAWVLLSIILGLAGGAGVSMLGIARSVGSVLAFIVLSFTAGRWFFKKALDFVQDRATSADRVLTLVVVLAFAWGAITQAIGLEALFGAFVAGILFGQLPRLPAAVIHKLESITLAVFAPIFFAVAGLKVNLLNLAQSQLIMIALVVIFIAVFGKVVGAYAGSRLFDKRDHWTALAFGVALNARGALEIIIATIGLNLGILTPEMFSIIVLMAMTTSLMAPAGLRWILRHVQPGEEEARRLHLEALAEDSVIANVHRVLLPVRRRAPEGRVIQTIEAHVLEKIGAKTDLSLTLFNVAEPGGRAGSLAYLQELSQMFSQRELLRKVIEGPSPADAILDEVEKDYDLLVLGSSGDSGATHVFTPLVDSVVRLAPCPTMIVRGKRVQPDWNPKHFLVPTNGSAAARHAAELGFALASDKNDEVLLLHVVIDNTSRYFLDADGEAFERELEVGQQMVAELQELGQARGVETRKLIQVGVDPVPVILNAAREYNIDLIILGTDLRPGSQRLFLGPRVERILKYAGCPVIVIND